jgi:hypothetical protein
MPVIPINYFHFIVLRVNVSLSLPSNKKNGFFTNLFVQLKTVHGFDKNYPMCHPKTCAVGSFC